MIPTNNKINYIHTGGKKHYKDNKTTGTFTNFLPHINAKLRDTEFSKTYNYKIAGRLKDIRDIKLYDNLTINFCIYRVNKLSIKPCLQYLLYKFPNSSKEFISKHNRPHTFNDLVYIYEPNNTDNLLIFPKLKYIDNTSIKELINDFIKITLNYKIDKLIECDGYLIYNNEPHIFINIDNYLELDNFKKPDTNNLSNLTFLDNKRQWWWTNMTEIINYGNICGYPIYNKVSLFFYNNDYLLYLRDGRYKKIESPNIGYVGNEYHKGIFNAIMGVTKATPWASLGPFYYFSTFQDAVKYGGWPQKTIVDKGVWDKMREPMKDELGRWKKGIIIRCINFPGRTKVLLNNKNDNKNPISFIDLEKLDDPKTDKSEIHRIYKSQRLKDNKGLWSYNYDSVYVGRVDIGMKDRPYKSQPVNVLQSYTQTLPISVQTIDKKSLGEKWDESANYNIE